MGQHFSTSFAHMQDFGLSEGIDPNRYKKIKSPALQV